MTLAMRSSGEGSELVERGELALLQAQRSPPRRSTSRLKGMWKAMMLFEQFTGRLTSARATE
jgi:hypothetical protein